MRFGLYGSAPDVISIDLANSLLFTAFAVTWTGARVFDHRKPLPVCCSAAPRFGSSSAVCRSSNKPGTCACCSAAASLPPTPRATAYEFWRGRSEPLVSRWPAIFMLFGDGALYLLRTPLGAMCRGCRLRTRCSRACG
jgi:hypothetical protein